MAKDTELAILFADVVGSTKLYDLLGDERARHTVGLCVEVMREATEQHGGTVIKTMGDEVMATFVEPDDALSAAAAMQQALSIHPELHNDALHIAVRIGCHYGRVVLENRDVFGAAVHTANRMTSQAKADQIVTSSTLIQKLSPQWKSVARQIDVATLRGRASEVELFEVLWQTEDVTSVLPSLALGQPPRERPRRLRLSIGAQQVVLGDRSGSVSMGRADENDLIVKGNLISRIHARIDVAKSHFVLVDQSTNGTYVLPDGGSSQFVRRDTHTLSGSGLLGFGQVPSAESGLCVRYEAED